VTADHVRAAVTDTQVVVAPRAPRRRLAFVGAAGLAAGVLLGYGLAQFASPPPAVVRSAAQPPASAPANAHAPPVESAAVRPAAVTVPAPPAPADIASPVRTLDPIGARTAAGRELLAPASSARYSVQLMVTDAREREYLESYLAEAGQWVEPARLFLVASGSPQSPRTGVLFGSFAGRADATGALAALPAPLRQFKPYVRSLDAVREEVRRAQAP
jgi:hypothetical protein